MGNVAAGGNAACEPDISTNDRSAANGDPSENCGISIDHDVVFDDGVSSVPLDQRAGLIRLKAFCTERHSMVKPDILADDGRFANHDTGSVVDKKAAFNISARMNVDSGC